MTTETAVTVCRRSARATGPLVDLRKHLERTGKVPLTWVVAHAPDGDLRALWARSRNGHTLLRLLGRSPLLRGMAPVCCEIVDTRRRATHRAAVRATARAVLALLRRWGRGQLVTPTAIDALLCSPGNGVVLELAAPAMPRALAARAKEAARVAYQAAITAPDAGTLMPMRCRRAKAAARKAFDHEIPVAERLEWRAHRDYWVAVFAACWRRQLAQDGAPPEAPDDGRVLDVVALVGIELHMVSSDVGTRYFVDELERLYRSRGEALSLPLLAEVVRAHVPCPTLRQLREAYRAG